MSVGLILITHEGIGDTLLKNAKSILNMCPVQTMVIEVPHDTETSIIKMKVEATYRRLNLGSGVLVLTDLYGATPCNIGRVLLKHPDVRLISGINLAMVLKILNYPTLRLDEMAEKALDGGKEGIILRAEED